jgi:hypothetical protein
MARVVLCFARVRVCCRLQNNVNTLTWLNFAGGLTASTTNAGTSSVNLARMYNKAGRLVELSVASLQSAMTDYQQDYAAGRFGIDIFDAPGVGSWPMAYLTFFAMRQNQTTDDCSNVGELLDFVAWIHTNDAYVVSVYPHYATYTRHQRTHTRHIHAHMRAHTCATERRRLRRRIWWRHWM